MNDEPEHGRHEDGYCCDGVNGIGHAPTCPLVQQRASQEADRG